MAYGLASAFAGVAMSREKDGKVPRWASLLFSLSGAVAVIGGALLIARVGKGAALVFAGLVSLLVLAVYNGRAMHGRVNPVHLLVRLVISVLIVALALSSWDG